MKYFSTRGGDAVTASLAIVRGISPSGGLYVPEAFPRLDIQELAKIQTYEDMAAAVMGPYLPDTDEEQLRSMIAKYI